MKPLKMEWTFFSSLYFTGTNFYADGLLFSKTYQRNLYLFDPDISKKENKDRDIVAFFNLPLI
jgi:hypothetical protein